VALTEGAQGWQRFKESVQVMLHHEVALLLNFGILWLMQKDQPNHVALCTYALLWFMRLSAKLNLYFGVPQNGAQYLPSHLVYLASYFRTRLITPWFVISISAAIGTWCWLVWQAQQGAMAITTGWVMLATLLGLAIVEHLIMIFPLPLERLWGWAMGQSSVETPLTTPH
jgi:putative photosynthetic complex assembly protein 2